MVFEITPDIAQVLQFLSIIVAGALSLIGALKDFGASTFFGYPRRNVVLSLASAALGISVVAFTVNFLIQSKKVDDLEYQSQRVAFDLSNYNVSLFLQFELQSFPELSNYFDFLNEFFDSNTSTSSVSIVSSEYIVSSAFDISTGDDTITRGNWMFAIDPYLVDQHVTTALPPRQRSEHIEKQNLSLWLNAICKRTFVISVWLPRLKSWKKARADIDLCEMSKRVRFIYDYNPSYGGKPLEIRTSGIPLNHFLPSNLFLSTGNDRTLLDFNGAIVVGQLLNHGGIVPPSPNIKSLRVSKLDGTGAVLSFFNDLEYFEDEDNITPGFILHLPCDKTPRNLAEVDVRLGSEVADGRDCGDWREFVEFLRSPNELTAEISEYDDWEVVDWSVKRV